MLTFKVSDVDKVTAVMPNITALQALKEPCWLTFGGVFDLDMSTPEKRAAYDIPPERLPPEDPHVYEACVAQVDLVQGSRFHPFVAAVWTAFQEHRPLSISPDALWLLLLQGVGQHILLHAQELREQFVQHEGQLTLTLQRDDFVKGAPDNPWPEVFSSFSSQMKEHLGKKHALFLPDFSTTTPTTRAACEVVLMAAMQKYFAYELFTLCGIPEITLEGTLADWQAIRARAAYFAEFGLAWWLEALLPLLDKIVETVEKPDAIDRDFWRSLLKRKDESGGPYINGWINILFPYVGRAEKTRNLALFGVAYNLGLLSHETLVQAMEEKQRRVEEAFLAEGWPVVTSTEKFVEEAIAGQQRQLSHDQFPPGLSAVPFMWDYLGERHAMEFVAGFVGVSQDPETSALSPTIGWAVREALAEAGPASGAEDEEVATDDGVSSQLEPG